jgi:intracellular multiplication protein IcmG
MSNKDNNEEFEFNLDEVEVTGDPVSVDSIASPDSKDTIITNAPDVRKNALIAVGLFIIIILVYKLGTLFFSKQGVEEIAKPAPVVASPDVKSVEVPQLAPVSDDNAVQKMVSTISLTQATLRSDVDNLGSQMTSLNTNLASISDKLSQLTSAMDGLNASLAAQEKRIQIIEQKLKPKVVKKTYKPRGPVITYAIQAIIPGRAWLIGSNGLTLTIREGQTIQGLGTIRLIDANGGRVVLTNGRVIKFAQDDS